MSYSHMPDVPAQIKDSEHIVNREFELYEYELKLSCVESKPKDFTDESI